MPVAIFNSFSTVGNRTEQRFTLHHHFISIYLPLFSGNHLILTYSALSLSSLHFPNTHTHTQAQEHYLALPILTSTRTLYIFLHSPHQQHNITFHFSLFTFLLDTDTVKIIALCTIGSDPFLYLETLCLNKIGRAHV